LPGCFIAQYDTAGTFISATKIENATGNSIAVDGDNNIYIGGNYKDSAIFDDQIIYGGSNNNMFIAKLKPATSGITDQPYQHYSVKVYPNPTSNGAFTIESDEISNTRAEILIYNNLGQLIWTNTIKVKNKLSTEITLSNINKGIYIIRLKTDHSINPYYSKLVISD
jgi:hypothetical protein